MSRTLGPQNLAGQIIDVNSGDMSSLANPEAVDESEFSCRQRVWFLGADECQSNLRLRQSKDMGLQIRLMIPEILKE